MNKLFFGLLLALAIFIIPSSVLSVGWIFDADPPSNTIDIKCGADAMPASHQCDKDLNVTFTCADTGGSNCDYTNWGRNDTLAACLADTLKTYTPPPPDSFQINIPYVPGGGYSVGLCARSYDKAGNSTFNTASFVVDVIGSWFKLKDVSFNSLGNRSNVLPNPPTAFDADDDTSSYLITATGANNAGVVLGGAGITLGNASPDKYSKPNNWRDNATLYTAGFLPSYYWENIKANKNYNPITDLTNLTADTINYFSGDLPPIVTADLPNFNGKNLVLLVNGNITIADNFTPDKSVAIISTGTITINSSVILINAILIGNNIVLQSSTNGLKIKGNLISSNAVLTTNRDRSDTKFKPSLFVVFDAQKYIDLLPLLSIMTYDRSEIN